MRAAADASRRACRASRPADVWAAAVHDRRPLSVLEQLQQIRFDGAQREKALAAREEPLQSHRVLEAQQGQDRD